MTTELFGRRVRVIDLVTTQVTTLAGSGNNAYADGQGTQASFSEPEGVAISRDDTFVLVVEGSSTTSHRVRHIVIATGVVTTLAGNGAGYADGVGTLARFQQPRGIALSPDGSYALITDSWNNRVRRLDMVSNTVTSVAGSGSSGFADGTGTNARFNAMSQIAIDPTGSFALICDFLNNRIRRLEIVSSHVSTLAGSSTGGFQDGVGTSAIFNSPQGVSIDPTGMYALIADYASQRIRRIVIATAQVSTVAGTGAASAVNGAGAQATFNQPTGICIDASGTFALVADYGNSRIRHIALSSAPCISGHYCPAGSSAPTTNACPAGFYCPIGSSNGTLLPCASGSYCPSSSSASTACPAGSFCANTASVEICLPGTYCPARSTAASPCAPGYFCASGSVFSVLGAIDGQGLDIFVFLVLLVSPPCI